MSSRFKDFGSPVVASSDPVEFSLYGDTFHAAPAIQGRILMKIARVSSSDDPQESAGIVEEFFQEVLTDESWDRFSALLGSKDKIVPIETLGEIVGWLVEQYSNRPEAQRED